MGVPHAFSTRAGGYSVGVFASLNFGNPGDIERERRDPATNIAANLGLVMGEIGAMGREIVQVYQVHGAEVRVVRRGGPTHEPEWNGNDTKADAIVTDDPGRVLVIRVADCAPVLLASRDGKVVGAVHAGWRGVVAGVAERAVEAMRGIGAESKAGEIVGAVGPCIGAEVFEVGPEVAAEFRRVFGAGTSHVRAGEREGKFFVDMKAALCEQLTRAGVGIVDVLAHCTVTTRDEATGAPLFFSHRRDKGMTGRMVGVIGVR